MKRYFAVVALLALALGGVVVSQVEAAPCACCTDCRCTNCLCDAGVCGDCCDSACCTAPAASKSLEAGEAKACCVK